MKEMKSGLVRATVVLAIIAGIVTVTGCGGGGGGGTTVVTDTYAPVLSNAGYSTASTLTFQGGDVTLHVSATDDVGVASVNAAISVSGTLIEEKTMSLSSGSTYTATYDAPTNTSSSAVTYSVVFVARDAAGHNSSPASTSFTVPVSGSDGPPAPPSGF